MVDDERVSGEKQVTGEDDAAALRRMHRRTRGNGEVFTAVR